MAELLCKKDSKDTARFRGENGSILVTKSSKRAKYNDNSLCPSRIYGARPNAGTSGGVCKHEQDAVFIKFTISGLVLKLIFIIYPGQTDSAGNLLYFLLYFP